MKPEAIGRALRLIRIFHQLKQGALAGRLGISNSYLSEIETGSKLASLDLLAKYAELFKIPVSSLMMFSERLDEHRLADRLRVKAGDKVLRMLEWIAESEQLNNEEEEKSSAV
jgi:transcriptional regulator with XRE-family HTH domain